MGKTETAYRLAEALFADKRVATSDFGSHSQVPCGLLVLRGEFFSTSHVYEFIFVYVLLDALSHHTYAHTYTFAYAYEHAYTYTAPTQPTQPTQTNTHTHSHNYKHTYPGEDYSPSSELAVLGVHEVHRVLKTRIIEHLVQNNGNAMVLFDEVQKLLPGVLEVIWIWIWIWIWVWV
ncbi:hypothetical protein EON65_31705 [archaeon]|nr:MAG: hypothetical protein EON65_31705 [archaeon]